MNSRHWFILATFAVIGAFCLGFMHLAYSNGFDPIKDGALTAVLLALVGAALKFVPNNESK
jgi:hypothetical protein